MLYIYNTSNNQSFSNQFMLYNNFCHMEYVEYYGEVLNDSTNISDLFVCIGIHKDIMIKHINVLYLSPF